MILIYPILSKYGSLPTDWSMYGFWWQNVGRGWGGVGWGRGGVTHPHTITSPRHDCSSEDWTILALILRQFLGLKFGMRYKGLHNESNMLYLENKSVMETVITSHYNWVGFRPLLCLYLRNSFKHSRQKCSTYMNHGKDETWIQKSLIPRGKHHVCVMKTRRFLSGNQWFWVWVSSLP